MMSKFKTRVIGMVTALSLVCGMLAPAASATQMSFVYQGTPWMHQGIGDTINSESKGDSISEVIYNNVLPNTYDDNASVIEAVYRIKDLNVGSKGILSSHGLAELLFDSAASSEDADGYEPICDEIVKGTEFKDSDALKQRLAYRAANVASISGVTEKSSLADIIQAAGVNPYFWNNYNAALVGVAINYIHNNKIVNDTYAKQVESSIEFDNGNAYYCVLLTENPNGAGQTMLWIFAGGAAVIAGLTLLANSDRIIAWLRGGSDDTPEVPDSSVQVVPEYERPYMAVYNYQYYRANNPDLVAAFGDNRIEYLNHFIECGIVEGRQASASFNVQAYRANNPDLNAAFGDNLAEYYKHYVAYGQAEGRVAR